MGRTFLLLERTLIDVVVGELIMIVNNEQVVFNIFMAIEYLESLASKCMIVNIIRNVVTKVQ